MTLIEIVLRIKIHLLLLTAQQVVVNGKAATLTKAVKPKPKQSGAEPLGFP